MCYNKRMIEKRVIAFDIGSKRIGVAISDPFNEYAMPCETYVRTRNFSVDIEAIAKIAKDRGVGEIVCGMPFNVDGTESIQTVKTREFVEALREKTELPIALEDERFTTMQGIAKRQSIRLRRVIFSKAISPEKNRKIKRRRNLL